LDSHTKRFEENRPKKNTAEFDVFYSV